MAEWMRQHRAVCLYMTPPGSHTTLAYASYSREVKIAGQHHHRCLHVDVVYGLESHGGVEHQWFFLADHPRSARVAPLPRCGASWGAVGEGLG